MAKTPIFKGAGVAIVTPFKGTNQESVDFDKLGELIDFQIKGGTDAIVICGTTGEASTMPDDEHLSVIEYAVKKTAGRVPVIAGAGSNDTVHAIKLSQRAEELGADGLLSVTPYYNKTTQSGLIKHFEAICGSVSIPVILYNVPGRTGMNINPDTLEKLCKIPNVNAIKECNLNQVSDVKAICGDELNIYSGEDGQVSMMMGAGACGVMINHCEKPMSLPQIKDTIKRARELVFNETHIRNFTVATTDKFARFGVDNVGL